MLRISNSLEVPKNPGCGACNDPAAQQITDTLFAGLGNQEARKVCNERVSISTIQRHYRHLKDSMNTAPTTPSMKADSTTPKNTSSYPLADPSLSSEAVRLIALEEMIRSAERLRDLCRSNSHFKTEEAYLRALGQIESVASKLKFTGA